MNSLNMVAVAGALKLSAITPSDSETLPTGTRGLYIGGSGSVAVLAANDTSPVTLASVPAGAWLPISARKVMATGTTATSIVAAW